MTMPEVSNTQSGMESAIREFESKVDDFNGQLKKINTTMSGLQATWTGRASASFNQAMDEWERHLTSVINELIKMLDVMGVNTRGYRDAEDTAANVAQNFSSALPGI